MTKKTRAKARRALLTLSLVLVMMMVAVGGTLAWLTDKTDSVVNTFSPTNIDITLTEDKNQFEMVPGVVLTKNPTVTVKANSETAYVFVKVEKANNFDNYMTYTMDSAWTELTTGSGIYYKKVEKSAKDVQLPVIKNNQVTVLSTLDNADMAAANPKPTLTITAYAVQATNGTGTEFTPADAWTQAQSAVKYGN